MKTRREFFKTLAGSMAVVAACVMAPKSLMAKEEKLLEKIESDVEIIYTGSKDDIHVMAWNHDTGRIEAPDPELVKIARRYF